jgi:SulP family sulfate permease
LPTFPISNFTCLIPFKERDLFFYQLLFSFSCCRISIESLILNLIDEMTESRGSGNRECVAQGGANILNGLFGEWVVVP